MTIYGWYREGQKTRRADGHRGRGGVQKVGGNGKEGKRESEGEG